MLFVENIPQKHNTINNGHNQCMRLDGRYQCDDKMSCCEHWWKHNVGTYIYPCPDYVLNVYGLLVEISSMLTLILQSLSIKLHILFSSFCYFWWLWALGIGRNLMITKFLKFTTVVNAVMRLDSVRKITFAQKFNM